MTEAYLQIMIESLEKKNEVLDKIIELDHKQLEIATKDNVNLEEYDESMDSKGKLIDELNKLDDGFTSTYEMVKDEVISNPDKYREMILKMQELIRIAVDKSVEVNTLEARNKKAMQFFVSKKHRDIRSMKVSNAAASKYYKAMSRINDVDPQLMDKKH